MRTSTDETSRPTKPGNTRTASARAIVVVVALLATILMSVSPASAGAQPVLIEYAGGSGNELTTRVSFSPERVGAIISSIVVGLDPIEGGSESATVRITSPSGNNGVYTRVLPPVAPGVYDLVILEFYAFEESVEKRIRFTIGGPVQNLRATPQPSGDAFNLQWDLPQFGVPNSISVKTLDFQNGLGSPPVSVGDTYSGDAVGATLQGLSQRGRNYRIEVTAHFDWGTATSEVSAITADPNAVPPTPPAPPAPPAPTADNTDPTITLNVASSASRYGSAAIVDFSCEDENLVSCESTHADGSTISTALVGQQTVTVTATDAAGNVATKSTTVDVNWRFSGRYDGVSGDEAVVARYYAATFGRLPDSLGFNFWVSELRTSDDGAERAAQFFATSPEFQALYGSNVSDVEFVDTIYVNVLGRAPEGAGRTFWINSLANGSHTRGSVMAFFANSPEHKTITGTT